MEVQKQMQEKLYPPMPIRATPYQHQRDAFAFACRQFGLGGYEARSQGTALLMEMGTGKTITSIAITGALYLSSNIRRVLVVAPLSILGVWDEEFTKFADFKYSLTVLYGSGAMKAEELYRMTGTPLQVAVVNYESAWRLEKEIISWKPDLVIADAYEIIGLNQKSLINQGLDWLRPIFLTQKEAMKMSIRRFYEQRRKSAA